MSKRRELAFVIALAAIFMIFTWRTLTMFFSGDDVMNMYQAWTTPALKIWKAQLLPWMPIYRPLGAAFYRVIYTIFGFHPLPFYLFCWLLMTGNVFLGWRFFRTLVPSAVVAITAVSLTLVHGAFEDLYVNAGTIYDQFCFLFTALAVIVYARARAETGGLAPRRIALLCLICLMAMNAKESGAAVPAILFCYECVFILPTVLREKRTGQWFRSIAPFYGLLLAIVIAFVAGRIRGTGMNDHPAYHPHVSLQVWMLNLTRFLTILLYDRVHFTVTTTAIVLVAMLALAALLRNKVMLFGWLFFVIAITPVALISMRQGYVMYVPYLGLGLYFATLIGFISVNPVIPVVVTALMIGVHAKHWPAPESVSGSSTWRLADVMQRNYPTLKPGAKFLFADDFPGNGYDLFFTLALMYHDPLLQVSRLQGPPEQQPDHMKPSDFDHVFTTVADRYVELDRRNLDESIRLNLLQDYIPGRLFDAERLDRVAYVVSGRSDFSRAWRRLVDDRILKAEIRCLPCGRCADAEVLGTGKRRNREAKVLIGAGGWRACGHGHTGPCG